MWTKIGDVNWLEYGAYWYQIHADQVLFLEWVPEEEQADDQKGVKGTLYRTGIPLEEIQKDKQQNLKTIGYSPSQLAKLGEEEALSVCAEAYHATWGFSWDGGDPQKAILDESDCEAFLKINQTYTERSHG